MFTKKELKALRNIPLTESYFDSDDAIRASEEGANKAFKQAEKNYSE